MTFDQSSRRRVYALDFKPYPGLVVRCRKPSFRALTDLAEVVLVLGDDLSGEDLSGDIRLSAWTRLFSAFADSLVSWTLIDDGRAVPATVDGVLAQDTMFLLDLARTWYTVVVPDQTDHTQPAEHGDDAEDVDDIEDELSRLPVTLLPAPDDEVPVSA
jgi:hypothetical protein